MSSSTPQPTQGASIQPARTPRKPSLLRKLKISLLLVLLAVSSLAVPGVFCTTLRVALHLVAWNLRAEFHSKDITGSLWNPVVITKPVWLQTNGSNGSVHAEADRLVLRFSPKALLQGRSYGFLDHASAEGLTAKIRLSPLSQSHSASQNSSPQTSLSPEFRAVLAFFTPARVSLQSPHLIIQGSGQTLSLVDFKANISPLEKGALTAQTVSLSVNSWTKSFRNVSADIALQGTKMQLGKFSPAPDIHITSFSTDLVNLLNGRANLELAAEAFDGALRIKVLSPEKQPGAIDVSLSGSKISAAPAAAFLGLTDAAGGTLSDIHFSFLGDIASPRNASGSLRLEIENFQWESRQWNHLILGGTFVNGRLTIPELNLKQENNLLSATGEVSLAEGVAKFWKNDFSLNVTARIDDLTQLSALLLPEFKYAAGKLTADGAIRNKAGLMSGTLILTGNRIVWRRAPIEQFHAAFKLDGKKVLVSYLEALNGRDQLRGKGSFTLGSEPDYAGELHLDVAELSRYADLLTPPLSPFPLRGSAFTDWNGSGSKSAHQGKFETHLSHLAPLTKAGAWTHQLTGKILGEYSQQGIHLQELELTDGTQTLHAKAEFLKDQTRITELSYGSPEATFAKGHAAFPMDLQAAWPSFPKEAFSGAGATDIDFQFNKFRLEEISPLFGLNAPSNLLVDGHLKMSGTDSSRATKGRLLISGNTIPWTDGHNVSASATVDIEGHAARISDAQIDFGRGIVTASGTFEFPATTPASIDIETKLDGVAFRNLGSLRLLASPESVLDPARNTGIDATLSGSVHLSGALAAPTARGQLMVNEVLFHGLPDATLLWASDAARRALRFGGAPTWAAQTQLDLNVTLGDSTKLSGADGRISGSLQLGGPSANPNITGSINATLKAAIGGLPVQIERLQLTFAPPISTNPKIEASLIGSIRKSEFKANASGYWNFMLRDYSCDPSVPQDKLRQIIQGDLAWPLEWLKNSAE
jgi:hypothetical protein